MRCEQCIFQETSLSSPSSPRNDDIPIEFCKQCSNGGGSSAGGKGLPSLTGAILKHEARPTQIKELLGITDPLRLLIMESFPVKIEWSETYGRYLVATRNIAKSELIFQLEPIITGPTPSYNEKDWICMGCFRVTKKKAMVRCSDCQWPFCCSDCAKDEVHKEMECLVLAKAKVLPEDNYAEHITLMQLLRCLLVKNKDPEGWKQILTMESHVEGRKYSPNDVWERWRKEELKFIHGTLGLLEFDAEEINFVSGVLSMNAFGSNDVHGVRHRHGSYLYYLGAMAAHDCSPNTDYEVDENQFFNLKAIVDIKKGTQITISYALPFQGTLFRRDYLKDYFFLCSCKRCSDGLEFGSYFSALKCSSCSVGFLMPDHPLIDESPWKCSENNCDGKKRAPEVNKILKDFDNLRESPEYSTDSNNYLKNIETLVKLLEIGEPLFHPNHFSLMGVEFELIQKIQYYLELGKIAWKWNDRLLSLTRKHIEVGQLIWPGLNDRYGRLLYFLQAALLNTLVKPKKCHFDESTCSVVQIEPVASDEKSKKVIQEVMKVRREARLILLTRSSGSYEHTLGLKLKGIMNLENTEADLVSRVQKLSMI